MKRALLLSSSFALLAMFACEDPGNGEGSKNADAPGHQAAPKKETTPEPKLEDESKPDVQEPKQEDAQEPKGDETPDPDGGTPQPDPDKPKDPEGKLTEPQDLPKITGKCPDLSKGGPLVFRAEGMNKHRIVQIFVDPDAKGKKGPLIFYWHGTGMNPAEALVGLGDIIEKVTSMGGMVVAPFRDVESGVFPWYLTTDVIGGRDDDLLLADEVLACAMDQVGIDTRRIHTLGLSAGALHSTQMSYRRSNYIASSVLYSGGLIIDPPPSKEPRNRFASMIFHGGPADIVVLPFQLTSERFYKAMHDNNQQALMCTHMTGHIIPPGVHKSVWQFFQDHPFGAESPYKDKLPEGFPGYCDLHAKIDVDKLEAAKDG